MNATVERIVIGVAFVALVALVIARYRTPADTVADIPVDASYGDQTTGPMYLLGNAPWAYQPWVGNVTPQVTAGAMAQSPGFTQKPLDPNGNCFGGCN
jgi:hypothetical protein